MSDLSDLTRFQSGKFSVQRVPLRLDMLLQETVDIGQALVQTQTMVLTMDKLPVVVRGDAQRLQQVVLNSHTNALAHASGSRRIDVRLRQTNDMAEMDVQNYGAGIAEDHRADLFSRLYQVAHDRSYTGKDLGWGCIFVSRLWSRTAAQPPWHR